MGSRLIVKRDSIKKHKSKSLSRCISGLGMLLSIDVNYIKKIKNLQEETEDLTRWVYESTNRNRSP
jgi:hypothetical protein